MPSVSGHARAELSRCIGLQRAEIEQAALGRIHAISDLRGIDDPTYQHGLHAAISAALDYALTTIKQGELNAPPVPRELLSQASLAARNGVSLDTVLRRYVAGYALFGDFLIEAAGQVGVEGAELKRVFRSQAALLDQLLAAVGEEYVREASSRPETSERRRADLVRRLLNGEILDPSDLRYEFDGQHLGLVASGPGVPQALRSLATALNSQILLVHPDKRTVWAWFGNRQGFDRDRVDERLFAIWPSQATVAVGEPVLGLTGWRLTHRQAAAALPIAHSRLPKRIVRYADVALTATALKDDLLASSLRQLYLLPLEGEREGGEVARETLRAYFVAQRNVSSSAALLGISRRTVTSRLQAIEERLERSIDSVELEVALRLEEASAAAIPPRSN